jgi:hypothetical protein
VRSVAAEGRASTANTSMPPWTPAARRPASKSSGAGIGSARPVEPGGTEPEPESGPPPSPNTSTVAGPDRHSRAPGVTARPSARLAVAARPGATTTPAVTAASAAVTHRRRRDRSTASPITAATTSAGPAVSDGRGRAAATRATPAIQPTRSEVGRWITRASRPPTTPAGMPAASPHTITGPAAGAARRLAGSDTTGRPPKVGMRTGATPIWAAALTARATASERGPGARSARGRARTTMPADAATERRKPIEKTSRGSTSTSPATASASSRMPDCGRPLTAATRARAAMASARRTDGSHRVSNPNSPRVASPASSRAHSGSRRRSGPARARTKATFSPDTASRWARPEARKSSTTSGRWPRSSPRTKPVNKARRSGGSDAAPATSARRSPLASRLSGPPGDQPSMAVTERLPARWR